MSRLPRLVIAALAVGPFAAAVSASLSLAPDTTLVFTAAGTLRYDDNIFLAPDHRESDTIFVVMPGAELSYGAGDTKAGIVARDQFVRYADHSTLDSDLPFLSGDCAYEGPRSRLAVKAAYQEFDQSSLTIRNAEQAIHRNLTTANLDGSWEMSPKTRFGAGIDYVRNDYPHDLAYATYDSRDLSFPLDVYYQYDEKVDLSLGYRYRRANIDGGLTNSKDHFFNLGAKGDFTPKLGGQVRVGINQRNFDRGGSESQLGLGASLTYVYSPKLSFQADVSNDFSSSALGASVKVFSVRTATRLELSSQWNAEVGLSFDSTRYGIAPSATLKGRRDDFTVADFTLRYAVTQKILLQGTYVLRTNASNRGLDFTNNLLSAGASFRF